MPRRILAPSLVAAIALLPAAGDEVELTVSRGSKELTLEPTVTDRTVDR